MEAIETEDDYLKALERIEDIFDAEPGSDEGDELDKLTDLVLDYESRIFRIKGDV